MESFKDDLAFLNKIKKREDINRLTNAFKNVGRGHVKLDKKRSEEGKWGPVVGSYSPKFEIVQPKECKYLTIPKQDLKDEEERARLEELKARRTVICDRFFKKEID